MGQVIHTPLDGNMSDRVAALQQAMLKDITPIDLDTKHRFHGGMYMREVFRPATCIIVGKVHKREHFYIVLSGTVVITTDDGVIEVTGPHIFESTPGTKRAVYAKTDAVCATIHCVDSVTVEDVEKELVEDDPDCVYLPGNTLKERVLA
jgi:quercetin dioxygenase-like cupin family protein